MDELPGFDTVKGSKPLDGPASCEDTLPESEPTPRLKEINRKQLLLRPVDVERLVPPDHEVRAIWEFTGHLDLTAYYQTIHAVEGRAGCAAFDPRLLLSIWIYAYSKGVGSAREISRLCDYDPAYQWLTAMEPINYHTLADFRSSHKESLDRLFVEVLGIMSAEGLITLERVMQDGTKIKALADGGSFRREERIREHLHAAEEQVRQAHDSGASCKDEQVSLKAQKARQRAVQEKKERMDKALRELEKIRTTKSGDGKKEARTSMTDPDARIMKQSDGGYAPSYNVQLSTDAAAGVIIGVGVSQHPEDSQELMPAVERIEENTGKIPGQVVADNSYTNWENVIAMNEAGVDFIGSIADRATQMAGGFKQRGVDAAFYPEHFAYDEASDAYTCPEGKILRHNGRNRYSGGRGHLYRARKGDCASCPHKEQCCPGKMNMRTVTRRVHDPAVAAFMEKMKTEEAKEIYKQRGAIAEFPNAWIKEKIGLRQFHLRGLVKVGMEAVWACLTYNIQQWIRLCWRPRLAKAGV
jgi:transposase